jgi:hypothetical protein
LPDENACKDWPQSYPEKFHLDLPLVSLTYHVLVVVKGANQHRNSHVSLELLPFPKLLPMV